MADDLPYTERVNSSRTEVFFLALTIIFFLLLIWRMNTRHLDVLAIVFFCIFVFFLFYWLNYHTLTIRLTPETLKLKFGIFTWNVAIDNVESCRLDDLPLLMRIGGAGIHFMVIQNRYRASFNFLEHPRVVIELKRKAGPVRDISFSTRQPEEVIRLIREAIAAKNSAYEE